MSFYFSRTAGLWNSLITYYNYATMVIIMYVRTTLRKEEVGVQTSVQNHVQWSGQ